MGLDPKEYIFQEVIEGQVCTVDYVRAIQTENDFCLPRDGVIKNQNGAGITVKTFECAKIN